MRRGERLPALGRLFIAAAAAWALAAALPQAQAATLRVANQGDATSMDPHSLNESMQLSFTGNVYEPLVARNRQLELVPGLATAWKMVSPTVWRFDLRPGVRFHDGSALTADDVVFSFRRAAGEGSDLRSYLAPVREVRRIGDLAVEIETNAPYPILPDVLTVVYVMNRAWCEQHHALTPVDRRKGIENEASFKANGTGPYRLRERQPGTRTVLERHAGHWGPVEGNIDRVVFTPIGNDATRVAALMSGEIDLMEPVPLQDAARLAAQPGLRVMQGPEMRVIFLGMDQKRDELLQSDVRGRNPFRDRRVRQAVYQAIDIEAIRSRIMRGAATPTGQMVAPGVRGFLPELETRLPFDADAARRLLAEAGYPAGFEVGMNCPNDRYVNDAEICQAVASSLARVGIRVKLQAETKALYFQKVLSRNTSFYLLGWVPGTYDAHNVLATVIATPDGRGQGQFNLGGYSHPRIDELTARIQSESDPARRSALMAEALKLHAQDIGHIPLHRQALAWGLRRNLEVVQRPDNFQVYKWMQLRP